MEELIRRLNEAGVRYLLIGGQALRLEGMPRFSMDWDFLLPPRDEENLSRLNRTLEDELDMPVEPLGPHGENFVQTYQTRWGVVQFHLLAPGLRHFAELEVRSVLRETENRTLVRCVCTEDLLASKRAADRPQDQQDIAFLVAKLAAGQR